MIDINNIVKQITISAGTIEILWKENHPLSINTRTKKKMSLATFLKVFDRKFHNLKDVSTITYILKINKDVVEGTLDEFNQLVVWHTVGTPEPRTKETVQAKQIKTVTPAQKKTVRVPKKKIDESPKKAWHEDYEVQDEPAEAENEDEESTENVGVWIPHI